MFYTCCYFKYSKSWYILSDLCTEIWNQFQKNKRWMFLFYIAGVLNKDHFTQWFHHQMWQKLHSHWCSVWCFYWPSSPETTTTMRTTKLSEAAADSRWRLHADEADWLTERRKDWSVVTRLLLVPVRAAAGLTGGNAPANTEEEPCVTWPSRHLQLAGVKMCRGQSWLWLVNENKNWA